MGVGLTRLPASGTHCALGLSPMEADDRVVWTTCCSFWGACLSHGKEWLPHGKERFFAFCEDHLGRASDFFRPDSGGKATGFCSGWNVNAWL